MEDIFRILFLLIGIIFDVMLNLFIAISVFMMINFLIHFLDIDIAYTEIASFIITYFIFLYKIINRKIHQLTKK